MIRSGWLSLRAGLYEITQDGRRAVATGRSEVDVVNKRWHRLRIGDLCLKQKRSRTRSDANEIVRDGAKVATRPGSM